MEIPSLSERRDLNPRPLAPQVPKGWRLCKNSFIGGPSSAIPELLRLYRQRGLYFLQRLSSSVFFVCWLWVTNQHYSDYEHQFVVFFMAGQSRVLKCSVHDSSAVMQIPNMEQVLTAMKCNDKFGHTDNIDGTPEIKRQRH